MDNKAPDAFRTISEVADELDVPQHVLRFWETRFRDIRPMKRGGGRRYYRPDDIDLLRGIRHLLYGEGYTIRGVQRILAEEGIRHVQTVWQQADAPQSGRAAAKVSEAVEEENEDEEVEHSVPRSERRGLRDRLTSLIGEDLNARDSSPPRPDPPLQSAPEPQIDAADRIRLADRAPPVPQPRDTVSATVASQQEQPPQQRLSREDLRKLQAALHELAECRKVLAAG